MSCVSCHPIVLSLQWLPRTFAEGKVVLGFGERKAPPPFVNVCSKFLFLDQEPRKKAVGRLSAQWAHIYRTKPLLTVGIMVIKG